MPNAEYSRRMNRVLDYIDQHLDEQLSLDHLAQIAHFSSYHFHRVFSEWVGETLSDYIQRRRLARAAFRLPTRRQDSILDVAVAAGFSSGEAFARAFKRQYGMTPTGWRKHTPRRWKEEAVLARERNIRKIRNFDQTSNVPITDHEGFQNLQKSRFTVEIRDLPAKKVAYFRRFGPYGPGIPVFWQETVDPWLKANGFEEVSCYGIAYDDKTITPAEKCRYDACVEVPDGFAATRDAMLATLPGGKYAVANFHGLPSMISDAWSELFRGWLPDSGLQCDARPIFAHFNRNMQLSVEPALFQCELCIPICPL